jgi:hypothetical protein
MKSLRELAILIIAAVVAAVVGGWSGAHFSSHVDEQQFSFYVARDARARVDVGLTRAARSGAPGVTRNVLIGLAETMQSRAESEYEAKQWGPATDDYNYASALLRTDCVLYATHCTGSAPNAFLFRGSVPKK